MLPAPAGSRRADTARSGSGCGGSAGAVAGLGMGALEHRTRYLGKNIFLGRGEIFRRCGRGVGRVREPGGWRSMADDPPWAQI